MHFVDPACGSGSFLVGAYQYLLDWHLNYYLENPEKFEKANKIYKDATTKEYKLSIEEKRNILLNNIFGVDIDAQAVEVTKLSLFLKLLENEGRSLSSTGQQSLFRASDLNAKILPSMMNNIKCGNSLIGSNYYEDKDLTLFGIQEQRKVNVFDWDKQFPQVFAEGGFDCVIGNPPYLRVQGLRENYEDESKFYEQKYKSATGRFDFYVLFMERGFSLINKNGILSFILPHKFINADFGIGIRSFIYNNKALNYLVHFGAEQVFANASVYTCIIGLSHGNKEFDFVQVNPKEIENDLNYEKINEEKLSSVEKWNLAVSDDNQILDKINLLPYRVKDVFKGILQGIVSGDNKAFYLEDCVIKGKYVEGFCTITESRIQIEKEICKPIFTGKTIARYELNNKDEYIIYPYHLNNDKTVFYTEKELRTCFPKCYEYFSSIKKRLSSRGTASMKYPIWYALWNARNILNLTTKKIFTPDICYGSSMVYDDNGCFHNDTSYGLVLKEPDELLYKAYLAILNSSLTWFFLQKTGTSLRGGYFRFKTKYLEPFPLPDLDEQSAQKLSSLAEQQLSTHKQLAEAKSDADKNLLEQRIQILDSQINAAVYKLYGLTSEEIKIVEGK